MLSAAANECLVDARIAMIVKNKTPQDLPILERPCEFFCLNTVITRWTSPGPVDMHPIDARAV